MLSLTEAGRNVVHHPRAPLFELQWKNDNAVHVVSVQRRLIAARGGGGGGGILRALQKLADAIMPSRVLASIRGEAMLLAQD